MSNILHERDRSRRETEEALNRISLKIREEYHRAHRNKELEANLWNKFKDITAEAEYFRLKHIEALDIPYNILLFLSNKNTGKTTEIYRNLSK